MKKSLLDKIFPTIDKAFRKVDKKHILRTRNIRLIPEFQNRRGGKLSYAEWAHVIGIFQTLMYQNLTAKTGNKILDVGCGTGLMGIAAEPFTSESGSYTGIDIMEADVNFCKQNFPPNNYEFIHFNVANATYAQTQKPENKAWPLDDDQYDMVTALSVWTHLNEVDATFYFKEISRVLKKGGRAIITFFHLDQAYQESLKSRSGALGKYHFTPQNDWIFDQAAYASKNWFAPTWVNQPEDATAVTEEGIKILCEASGLKLITNYPGNWKENPGVYFQDVLIFEK